MLTINEQERLAYITGDTEKAKLLAELEDTERRCEGAEDELADLRDKCDL